MTDYERISLALLSSINSGIGRVLSTLVAIRPMPDQMVLQQAKLNLDYQKGCEELSRMVAKVIKDDSKHAKPV